MGPEGQAGRFDHPVAGSRMPLVKRNADSILFGHTPPPKTDTKKPLDDPPEY
jgi:hypothetical protein